MDEISADVEALPEFTEAELAAIRVAQAEVALGKHVAWADVKRWIASLGTVDELPPPYSG